MKKVKIGFEISKSVGGRNEDIAICKLLRRLTRDSHEPCQNQRHHVLPFDVQGGHSTANTTRNIFQEPNLNLFPRIAGSSASAASPEGSSGQCRNVWVAH